MKRYIKIFIFLFLLVCLLGCVLLLERNSLEKDEHFFDSFSNVTDGRKYIPDRHRSVELTEDSIKKINKFKSKETIISKHEFNRPRGVELDYKLILDVKVSSDIARTYVFDVYQNGKIHVDVYQNGKIFIKNHRLVNDDWSRLLESLEYDESMDESFDWRHYFMEKPVIYLYPERDTNIDVSLSNPERITCEYPKYNTGWNVFAKPNGDLVDLSTGKKLYSLYYESKTIISTEVKSDGFCVKGENIAEFLDEKLKILGLNYKEREEFIIYWLPRLEQNKYVYIRFLSQDEINQNMGLTINPEPDTLIRVMMSYKGLDKPIHVKSQKLSPIAREGFTVVEWGGTNIK